MSDYRYLVFPVGRQPNTDEAEQLKQLSKSHSTRLAVGVHAKTGGLVLVWLADDFRQAMATDRRFAELIGKLEVRGADLVEHCPFRKDASALRPIPVVKQATAGHRSSGAYAAGSEDVPLTAKELAAKEALGRSLLVVQKTLERHAAIELFAEWVPYLLVAAGTLVTLWAGWTISDRLAQSQVERRRDTTIQVMDEPDRAVENE